MVDPIKEASLMAEVSAVVEGAIEAGKPAAASWVTQEIVDSWAKLAEDQGHAGHYMLCAYGYVRTVVRKVVQRYKPSAEEADRQTVLPGYARLQVAYLVARDKEQVVVPISMLTDEEIGAKCSELESMAAGCLEHVKELKRYMKERYPASASST